MTTAIHSTPGTTPERTLFLAFALREKTWNSPSPPAPVINPVSGVSQPAIRRACCEKSCRPKSALDGFPPK
jgi:hypothetical protein